MASKEQRELMKDFEDHWGFEFMHKEEVRAKDRKGFIERWEHNLEWLRDHITETDHMLDAYRNATP